MKDKIEAIEIWEDIPNYEGYYQVSNHGRVKSFKRCEEGRIMKNCINNHGYYQLKLSLNGKVKNRTIHQLVAIVFLNHIRDGHKIVVDHINWNKLDNHVSNLQLISTRENTSKDRKGGTSKYIGVSWRKDCNKWSARIRIDGKKKSLGCFIKEEDAAEAYQKKLKEITNT